MLSAFGQADQRVDAVIRQLTGQSENIIKHSAAKALIAEGKALLPVLSARFTDNTVSQVYSKCVGRYLKRGELAMILADHIENLPYFTVIGLQNCTLESCDNNPNFVEYYLDFIQKRGSVRTVQKKYNEWLVSDDRKKYYLNKADE